MSVELEEGRVKTVAAAMPHAADVGRSGWLAALVRDVRLLLIALWLGSAVFFSATVAPSAFAVLRARGVANANEAAGSIVTRTLAVVNTGGFIIALFVLLTAFLFRQELKRSRFLAEVVSLAIMGLATGVGQWVIAARMLGLRAAMGRPIDDVAADDPLRASFNALHGYSVTTLGVAIIAAALALLLIARRGKQKAEVRG